MANNSVGWNAHYQNVLMPNTVVLFVQLILGILGNSSVLVVYSYKMRNTTEERYFIPILAAIDISAGTLSLCFYIVDNLCWVAFPSDGLCKFLFFMLTYFSGPSALILLFIALQRYLKICRPTGKQMTLFWRRFSIGLSLVFSCMYAAPMLYYSGLYEVSSVYNEQNVTGTMCIMAANVTGDADFYYFATVYVFVIANVLVMAGLYVQIGCVIYRRNAKKRRQGVQLSSAGGTCRFQDKGSTGTLSSLETSLDNLSRVRTKQNTGDQTKFNQMFFAIITLYIVSFVPTMVLVIIIRTMDDFWFSLNDTELGICVFMSRTITFNHVFNPFIYGFYDAKFRSEIKNIFCQWKGTNYEL